jgi:Holliday junction resolvase RusA-like endonuclease
MGKGTMTELRFTVPGHPMPSERVDKIPYVKAKKPGGWALGVIGKTPPKSHAYMESVALVARGAAARCPDWKRVFDSKMPIRVHIRILRKERRGDIDNYTKNVLDGIQKAGNVYCNDSLVTQAFVTITTYKTGVERTEVIVEPVTYSLSDPLREYCIKKGWGPYLDLEEE